MAREGLTAFQAVNHYFEEAARIIDLDEEMHSILTSTYREIAVQVPVRLDDGGKRAPFAERRDVSRDLDRSRRGHPPIVACRKAVSGTMRRSREMSFRRCQSAGACVGGVARLQDRAEAAGCR